MEEWNSVEVPSRRGSSQWMNAWRTGSGFWKVELFCDIELLRQENAPGRPFRLREAVPKAWKLLVSSCQRKLVERRQRWEPARAALVPVLPTFGCDECDAVHFKLWALRSHQMRAHQRRREARRCVPRFGLSRLQGGFLVETKGHSASGGGSETVRFGVEIWSARAVFG